MHENVTSGKRHLAAVGGEDCFLQKGQVRAYGTTTMGQQGSPLKAKIVGAHQTMIGVIGRLLAGDAQGKARHMCSGSVGRKTGRLGQKHCCPKVP